MKNEENNPLNADGFEQRLQRQPVREIPREWRAEILAASTSNRHATSEDSCQPAGHFSLLTSYFPLLKWACLAAVWVVIFALHHSARDTSPVIEAKYAPPSPQMIFALREQKELLVELEQTGETPQADQPKPARPGPQSLRREETAAV
jgi:hypothetical protein